MNKNIHFLLQSFKATNNDFRLSLSISLSVHKNRKIESFKCFFTSLGYLHKDWTTVLPILINSVRVPNRALFVLWSLWKIQAITSINLSLGASLRSCSPLGSPMASNTLILPAKENIFVASGYISWQIMPL